MLSTSSLGFVKISALFFYRRIFLPSGYRSTFSIFTIVSVVVVVLWTITFLVLLPLQCGSHFSALWITADHAKYCTRAEHELLAYVITDAILDVWIIGLPIPKVYMTTSGNSKGGELTSKIWVLRMTLRRRLAVIGVFLLALALALDHSPNMSAMLTPYRGLAASIARMVTWIQLEAGIYVTLLVQGVRRH